MRATISTILLFFYIAAQSQQNKALLLISGMIDSVKAIKTARFKVNALERIQGNYNKVVSESKLQTKPRKLYMVNKEKKLEILFVAGQYNNKAVVKPHVFPYLTLTLNPMGSLMHKNQHYSINELGFEFIARALEITLSKEKEIGKSLTYLGTQVKNNYKCHMLMYETKVFPYVEYTVLENETVSSIAAKLNANDYIIRTKNNLYSEFGYLKAGTKLQIPVFYCKKTVFFLDEKTLLPISVSVFDDIGLLENYDFTNIILNKPIDPKEFTKEYKDYHF